VKRAGLGVLLTSIMLMLSLIPALAQNTTGSVRGTVLDPQGRGVAGSEITITNEETAASRVDTSDKDGIYNFESLPVGRYSLNVVKEGFRSFSERNIVLHVNDNLTFDVRLDVGSKTETVEVVASSMQVELANGEVSGTLSGSQITDLPLNGRSFAQLVTMVPGVATEERRQWWRGHFRKRRSFQCKSMVSGWS